MNRKHVGTVCMSTSVIGRLPVIITVVKIGQRNIRKERMQVATRKLKPTELKHLCARIKMYKQMSEDTGRDMSAKIAETKEQLVNLAMDLYEKDLL